MNIDLTRRKMDNYQALMEELLDINYEFYQKGYITPTGGNISMRCTDEPEKIIITPSHIYKRRLKPENMLIVDLMGNVLNGRKLKPSTETPFHLGVYRARKDINAVIHTHAVYATILGLTDTKFVPVNAEIAMLQKIPIIGWTSGTEESSKAVVTALDKNGYFVLIQNHGLVVAGPTLTWAAEVTDMIEVSCKILVTCRMMGVEPHVIPQNIVDLIRSKMQQG
jgi:ribulose-5-phosphate 4-epimerase/fuculose-1-phosphate aldolase